MLEREIEQALAAVENHRSILVIGGPGAGKTTIGEEIKNKLSETHTVAMVSYSGGSKELLIDICEQLDVPTEEVIGQDKDGEDRTKPLTAEGLRRALLKEIPNDKTILICDDANRWPVSLRYWLESLLRKGAVLLLLADNPPSKDVFLKVPRITIAPIASTEIRSMMIQAAEKANLRLSTAEIADLEQRCGGNPALANRVISEHLLGIGEEQGSDHRQYVDGTPFVLAAFTVFGIVRFIGLGMNDRTLYIIGGICTLMAIALKTIFTQANRGSYKSRLG